MFLDEATIDVSGGNGGAGAVAWRREKYEPKGGPFGGDGGQGGDVYFETDPNTDTLSSFASRNVFHAEDGKPGMGAKKHGRDGRDLVLKVPPGTVISGFQPSSASSGLRPAGVIRDSGSKTTDVIADLQGPGDQVLAARGGRGGYGNAHFATSVRQRPDFAELGEPGQQRKLKLELKLVADVGIIGYPSVGKSTLISVISAAKPKIADYPFTTLVPNLGVVNVRHRTYVVCDVPGLIEGASEGKGLGHQFLKHIERCGLLLHMLDASRGDADQLKRDYEAIRKELKDYSPTLADKRELIVLNKVDLIPDRKHALTKDLEHLGLSIFVSISAATTEGIETLTKQLLPIVLEEREKHETRRMKPETPTLTPHLTGDKMGEFTIERKEDGSLVIHGKRLEQLAAMTDFKSASAIQRFRNVCERIGLTKALERERSQEGQIIVGEIDVGGYL